MTAPHERRLEIDLLKGLAILFVLLIHSKALSEGALFLHVVNRAVPLFVILFGLNARLWWRERALAGSLRTWYATRAERILVPFWGTLLVWWALALWYRPFGVELHAWLPLVHVAGVAHSIGTGWFVTMILLLALLYPALEAALRRFGIGPVLALAVAGELATVHAFGDPTSRIVPMSQLVFPPRVLGHVAFGALLADQLGRIRPPVGAAAAALWACGTLLASLRPELAPYARELADLPLAVALLAVLRPLAGVQLVGPGLAWLGRASWGVYLGQLLVHNAVVFRCGFHDDLAPNLAACGFPFAAAPATAALARWLYTGVLLVGALGFVAIGSAVVRARRARRPTVVG